MRTLWLAAAMAAALTSCATPEAEAPPAAAAPATPVATGPAPNDYANGANWLCRPGRQDACAQDQSATSIAGNGRLTPVAYTPAADPAFDCFYVYPTVSMDVGGNSDMNAGPEELSVINAQFARFGSVCRTFAPLYRQATLTALRGNIVAPNSIPVDRQLGYNDVLAAWNYYLEHDNNGRGVILIGHSQGSGVLTQLIRNEIDGKPVQQRLISAMLIGTNVGVPVGRDVGGAFQNIPACRAPGQTGCVISYVTFRADAPPPANSRFGRVFNFQTMQVDTTQQALCTNPAALAGGSGALNAFLGSGAQLMIDQRTQWTADNPAITTPFVTLPGLLTAECVNANGFSYLAMRTNANLRDARTDTVPGDVVTNGVVQADWGLHLIDVQAAMGNLLDVARTQGAAYTARRP